MSQNNIIQETRGFFSLRYVIPGFTFLLVIIAHNFLVFFYLLQKNTFPDTEFNLLFNIFGLIISIFGLTSFGFLLSQIWYAIYHILVKKLTSNSVYDLFSSFHVVNNKDVIHTIADHFNHLEDQYILNYIYRRWDLFHTFGSIIISIIIGWIFTLIFNKDFIVRNPSFQGTYPDLRVPCQDLYLFAFFIAIIFCLVYLMKIIYHQAWDMIKYQILTILKKESIDGIISSEEVFWRLVPNEYRDSTHD